MKSDNNSFKNNIPHPRLDVENLKPYSAPLEGRRGFLRLDFNENTIGPSPLVVKAINSIPSDHISIYPEYDGLKELFAQSLNIKNQAIKVQASQVGLFNGVDAAIHAIFHAYGERGDQLLTTSPTFGYYTPCAQMQGMIIKAIGYEGKDFKFPITKIHNILKNENPKILMICNPNNPTGTRLDPSEIIKISKISSKTLVVIDELYEAFTDDSVLPLTDFTTIPNLVILRSLSKIAGLAGLRIGFALGNPEIIQTINSVTGPYDINSFAVTASFAAIKDKNYTDSYVRKVLEAKTWLKEQLVNYKIKHHIEGGNYCLIWPTNSASYIEECLRNEGILVRNMNNKNLISGSLRVSIGTINQMKRFWKVFKFSENI